MSSFTLRAVRAGVRPNSANFTLLRAPNSSKISSRNFHYSCLRRQEQAVRKERFNPLDEMQVRRKNEVEIAAIKRRMKWSAVGLACTFLFTVALTVIYPVPTPVAKSDAPPNTPDFGSGATVTSSGTLANVDLIETGTSSVPFFPRTITLPNREPSKTAALPSGTGNAESEYTLLGLGIRTVSFLSIQVYVVGIYVATPDLAALQAAFVKEGASTEAATTLIAGEKDGLRKKLLDHREGEEVWGRVLKEHGIRTVIRIVPTRNTDFGHLRDGFERNINARVRVRPEMAEDDKMGAAVGNFKAMLGKGKLAKGEEVLLERGKEGDLKAWFKGSKDKEWTGMGTVQDERISRLMLLGYLAGAKVASEPCRQNVIDGVIHVVERPVGTAETQVV